MHGLSSEIDPSIDRSPESFSPVGVTRARVGGQNSDDTVAAGRRLGEGEKGCPRQLFSELNAMPPVNCSVGWLRHHNSAGSKAVWPAGTR